MDIDQITVLHNRLGLCGFGSLHTDQCSATPDSLSIVLCLLVRHASLDQRAYDIARYRTSYSTSQTRYNRPATITNPMPGIGNTTKLLKIPVKPRLLRQNLPRRLR